MNEQDDTELEIDDTPSNPHADEHLPVAGEIVGEDHQISDEVLDDLDVDAD